jgi:hypothetical protein
MCLALAMASAENKVNFYALMKNLREQRPYIDYNHLE